MYYVCVYGQYISTYHHTCAIVSQLGSSPLVPTDGIAVAVIFFSGVSAGFLLYWGMATALTGFSVGFPNRVLGCGLFSNSFLAAEKPPELPTSEIPYAEQRTSVAAAKSVP